MAETLCSNTGTIHSLGSRSVSVSSSSPEFWPSTIYYHNDM